MATPQRGDVAVDTSRVDVACFPPPPPTATTADARWVQVEKSMLSRVLYPNPVCLLSVQSATDDPETSANVMTITWLTPINNQYLQTPGSIFVLNVPVRGMEELVLAIGGCSGASADKFGALKIATCSPGGGALTTSSACGGTGSADASGAAAAKTKKQRLSKQELVKRTIAEAASRSIAIQGCAAHVLCRVDTVQTDDGHYILRCTQIAAWCLQEYWDGKNFIPKSSVSEPYLTFLGSKTFGYVFPAPTVR